MTTTRRLSSLQGQGQGQSHQQTSLWLDSYETCQSFLSLLTEHRLTLYDTNAVKRKHIQQNKEIISKNSELNKSVSRSALDERHSPG